MHSILVLDKEAKIWFYTEYSIYTNVLVLWIRATHSNQFGLVLTAINKLSGLHPYAGGDSQY